MSAMRVIVVGAGAMGLPAARVLAERRHRVDLVEAGDVGNRLASSSGATRLWRLAHVERDMVRLAQRAVTAWHDLEHRTGTTLLLRRGLVLRGHGAVAAGAAVAAEGADAEVLTPERSRDLFPALRPDPAKETVWQPEAGPLLAAEALRVNAALLARAGGVLHERTRVRDVAQPAGGGVAVDVEGPAGRSRLAADVLVVAAGPWSAGLLERLGVTVRLRPFLDQVCYVTGVGWQESPCLYDWADDNDPVGKYCMPSPGAGYKVGADIPLRPFTADDPDRTPDPQRTALIAAAIARDLPGFRPRIVHSEVCSWTLSDDASFVLDRVGDVVFGAGDSGKAFKFSPLIGELLADLAEGDTLDGDAARFRRQRLVGL